MCVYFIVSLILYVKNTRFVFEMFLFCFFLQLALQTYETFKKLVQVRIVARFNRHSGVYYLRGWKPFSHKLKTNFEIFFFILMLSALDMGV